MLSYSNPGQFIVQLADWNIQTLTLLLSVLLFSQSALARVAAFPDNKLAKAEISPPQTQDDQVVTDPPDIAQFEDTVRSLLLREDFAGLDQLADSVRKSKARFPGGGWKLSRLYDATAKPISGNSSSEVDWRTHLALLDRWVDARPKSITARVSLADSYLGYAWAARGNGLAQTVTDQAWRLFGERAKQAETVLMKAEAVHSKCPEWYAVMHQVALALGANKGQLRALVDEGSRVEPDYFALYQEHAIALLPKWLGEPGDSGVFAEEIYRKVGGKEGAHIYFEIVVTLCNECGDFSAADFSWPRIQEGFASTKELYGLSVFKVNKFAWLASQYGDKEAASKAFLQIGSNWDPSVWGTRARFEAQRNWAGLAQTPEPVNESAASGTNGPNPFKQVADLLRLASQAASQGRRSEAIQIAEDAVKIAKTLPGTGGEVVAAYLIIEENEERQSHFADAQKALDRAATFLAERAGTESIEFASFLDQKSALEQAWHDDAHAEADLRRAMEVRRKVNGNLDTQLTMELNALGFICQRRERNKEALQFYQQAIETSASIRPDNESLIAPLGNLGTLYQTMGRNKEAEETLQRLVALIESRFGKESPTLVDPLSTLVSLYHETGDLSSEQETQARLQAIQQPK